MNTKVKPVPFELQANNISDLIEFLNKIKTEVGDLPMYLNYWEYSNGPIKIAASESNALFPDLPEEYLGISIQFHHKGEDLIEGIE